MWTRPRKQCRCGNPELDVRTLRRGVRTWSKLRGAAAPAEILVEAAAKRSAPIVERPSEPPAKQLGRGVRRSNFACLWRKLVI